MTGRALAGHRDPMRGRRAFEAGIGEIFFIDVLNVGHSVRPRTLYRAVKDGAAFGFEVDDQLLSNATGAILDDLPIDVLAQRTRTEEPSYTAKRLMELAAAAGVDGDGRTAKA